MKTIIQQQYKFPQVDRSILDAAVKRHKKRPFVGVIPVCIIATMMGFFLYEYLLHNIAYLDVLFSSLLSLPNIWVLLGNMALFLILFIYQNIALLLGGAVVLGLSGVRYS